MRLAQGSVDSYEGRKWKEREREYDVTYYIRPGLMSSTQQAAGQRYEGRIEQWRLARKYDSP